MIDLWRSRYSYTFFILLIVTDNSCRPQELNRFREAFG